MKLMKYKDILAMTKEKINEAMAPLRAREMRKQGELELCKLETEIVEKEAAIRELSKDYPLNFSRLIDRIDDLELLTLRKERFEEILKEMFAENDKTD